ncbi:MAG: hypothetical protein AB1306_12025, partial [Nitrospirota bacterium]
SKASKKVDADLQTKGCAFLLKGSFPAMDHVSSFFMNFSAACYILAPSLHISGGGNHERISNRA